MVWCCLPLVPALCDTPALFTLRIEAMEGVAACLAYCLGFSVTISYITIGFYYLKRDDNVLFHVHVSINELLPFVDWVLIGIC